MEKFDEELRGVRKERLNNRRLDRIRERKMKHQRERAEAKRKAEEEKERLGMEKFDDQTLFSLLEIRLEQSQFLDKPINLI